MTTNPTGGQLAPTIVRAELVPGVECLGEWTGVPDALGAVVLLHDLGSDLDSVRHLRQVLVSAGLEVLRLDLPGHGLSAGEYWTHGTAAVEAAVQYASERGAGDVAVVAHGHSCSLATGAVVAPVAAVLIDPRSGDAAPLRQESWNRVSTIFIQDPLDEVTNAEVDRTMAQMHAWTVRVDLHPNREVVGHDGPLARLAMPQVTGMTAKFLLEQLAYAAARSRRWSPIAGGRDAGQPGR
ncbi:MAG TPA: alpha/beta fold hydrolase [Nocardioides sp.]|jgi:pimeloyl-ACP methyl ester carboxylesterase|nr:alpha/beta fold hydrolase [Nocardioides sp.]